VLSLPMQAQSVISSALGSAASRFDARRSAAGWELRGGGLRATVARGQISFRAARAALSMRLAGVGRERHFTPAPPSILVARANRVTVERRGVREWYAAGPLGIEQGFTFERRPAGQGPWLTLALRLSGTSRAQMSTADVRFVTPGGQTALRYGGLQAVDASGRHLPSRLAVSNGRVLVHVDDSGARYPITVDPLVQQAKLVANDETFVNNGSSMGVSVAISADGNTAIAGGILDNGDLGAAWVFTRSGSTWSQQGRKLVPSDPAPNSTDFGQSVALSADGNTALIGGENDGGFAGAAWVFTRSGSTWTQQKKLTSGGAANTRVEFGHSVALSSDGNTALVGGPDDNNGLGAAWVFVRQPGTTTWSQQTEINPPDRFPTVSFSNVGEGVALSGDGNTALVGGPQDDGNVGAAWIYTRSSGTWTERQKLGAVINDIVGAAGFGNAVALSTDGATALIGGHQDGGAANGAAWVFTGSGANWTEQQKLTGAGLVGGNTDFGVSVSLSADGNVAAVGADQDAGNTGAAFLFTRSASSWSPAQPKLGGPSPNGLLGKGVALSSDGDTMVAGAPGDSTGIGAAFVFAPPNPVCTNVASTAPQGGGAVAVSLSCTLPAGANPAFSIVSGPSHGSISGLNGATGSLIYTSQAFFSGQDSFTYRVADQWGLSNTATATVTVPALPVPNCVNVNARGAKAATRVTVTLNCSGPIGHGFSYVVVSQPGDGRLGAIDQSTGRVTYTTHVGFSGSDRFVYEAIDAGGASAPATATITIPKVSRITSTMTWDFHPTLSTASVVNRLLVNAVPGPATVKLACPTKGCPIKARSQRLAKQRVCQGKGKKRTCHRVRPASGTIDFSSLVAGAHVKVGTLIKVSIVEPGTIGKQYIFKIRANQQPVVKITALAPGSTKPCPQC
jgi:hypothetical protein